MRVLLCIPLLTAIGCAHQNAKTSEPATAAAEPPPSASKEPIATTKEPIATNEQQAQSPARVPCQPVIVHFAFDSAQIPEGDKATLGAAAQCLKENKTLSVVVAGNTDDIGTSEYNQALGKERAQAVSGFLETAGASPAQLRTVSFGMHNPVCEEQDEACRARNRRTAVRAACHL
jgi:outer membrane protein OmpA-like peptidoglycan-associated protein